MKKSLLVLSFTSIFCINTIISNTALAFKTSEGIEYPIGANFVNDKEHGRIWAHCNEVKEKNGQIICTFNQIIVQHTDTKSTIDYINKLKNMDDKEIQSEFNCQSPDKDHGLNKRIEEQYNKAASEEERKSILYFKNVCANPSRANVTKLLVDILQKEQSTCTFHGKTFEQKFQYNNTTKQWIHNEGPDSFNLTNDCGIINIAYLKKDSRKGWDFSWNYVMRQVVTNKSGSVLGTDSCSKLTEGDHSVENELTYYGAYSNLVETTPLMNCKYINFADSY